MSCTCVFTAPTATTNGPIPSDDGENKRVYRLVVANSAYTVGDDVGQVDVATTGAVLTLPCPGKAGKQIIVNAIGGDVSLTTPTDANMSIVGQVSGAYTLHSQHSGIFVRNSSGQWSVIGGG